MTGPVQTIVQPKLFPRSAETVARRHQNALSNRHPDSRVEIPLQDPVIATRLVAVVALGEQRRSGSRSRSNRVAQRVRQRMREQYQCGLTMDDAIERAHRQRYFPRRCKWGEGEEDRPPTPPPLLCLPRGWRGGGGPPDARGVVVDGGLCTRTACLEE